MNGNEGPPKTPKIPEKPAELVDFAARRQEIMKAPAEKQFSREEEELLNTVRNELAQLDKTQDVAAIDKGIEALRLAFQIYLTDQDMSGVASYSQLSGGEEPLEALPSVQPIDVRSTMPLETINEISRMLDIAKRASGAAAFLRDTIKPDPATYADRIKLAKDATFSAAILLYDAMKAARVRQTGPK